MPAEYDQQLLESIAVRRRRMVAALLYGENRLHRTHSDGLRRTLVGVVLAAVLSAGCVGYSFAMRAFAMARAQQQQQDERTKPNNPSPSASHSAALLPADESVRPAARDWRWA